MSNEKKGCVAPAKGVIHEEMTEATSEEKGVQKQRGGIMSARVGHPAPDFEANVYHKGGFGTLKLSDYKGKWIVLCFYPGDFTFV